MADKSAVQCEMIIGYLVPHRCDNPSLGTCVKCGRGFCDEHTNQTREGRVCLACQQGLDMPVALPIAAATSAVSRPSRATGAIGRRGL